LFTASRQGVKTVLVTSPNPAEGKSTITANLAVALAQAGRRVILISADLRKPQLHQFFSLEPSWGLTDVLVGDTSLVEALVPTGIDGLRLISSGPMPGNHDALLGSEAMANLLSDVRETADVVLLDSPPLLSLADTMTVGPLVDAILLVADAGGTPRRTIGEARHRIDQMNVDVIGCILNNFVERNAGMYGRYGYGARAGETPASSAVATATSLEDGDRAVNP